MKVNVYSVTYVVEYPDGSVSDPQQVKVAANNHQQAQEAAWQNAQVLDPSIVTVRSIGGPSLVCEDVLVNFADGKAPEAVPVVWPSGSGPQLVESKVAEQKDADGA